MAGHQSRARRSSSRTADSRESARKGEVQAPAGAARVDLTGKTVIPALIDAHSHIGYMKNLTSGPANYTRDNILDHMHRFAYFGVAASQAMGSDFGDLPYQLRDELQAGKVPGRREVSHRGSRARAGGRSPAGQHAALGIHDPDRRRCPEGGPGAGGAPGDDREDLGGRQGRNRPKAHTGAVRRDHRRGTQAEHACRRARHRSGGRQGSPPRRHRYLRAHDQRRG